MIDIDRFKRINDEHSHEAGDEILVQLGAMLEDHVTSLAPAGFCARLGGEEFLLVAPVSDPAAAMASIEALRQRIEGHRWAQVPDAIRPTVSTGLVVAVDSDQDATTVLARADQLLYLAKRGGRNRVEAIVLGDAAGPSLSGD